MTAIDWRPLQGVSVLDMTSMLPGGTATRLLSDLGADVTKIEPPAGDSVRALQPRVAPDSSVQHHYLDGGKRSVRVDLKTSEGREHVRRLASSAQVVVESFRPGVADRLGVGYHDLSADHESLVYLSLSGYGHSGTRCAAAGHDLNFVSLAGALGRVDRVPPLQVADVTGGILAALGIAAGALASLRDGVGAHIDLALADAALFVNGLQTVAVLSADDPDRGVVTPLDGQNPCYQIYQARDGRNVSVGAVRTKFWRRICELIGEPDWVARQYDPTLVTEFAARIVAHPSGHWRTLLERDDTCVTVDQSALEVALDPHFVERGSLRSSELNGRRVWTLRSPFHVAAHPADNITEKRSAVQ